MMRRFFAAAAMGLFIVPVPAMADSSVIIPRVSLIAAPLSPSVIPPAGPGVMMSYSPFYVPQRGMVDTAAIYQPVREGGFTLSGGGAALHRQIVQGQNRLWTGNVPLFRMNTCQDSISLWLPKGGGPPKGLQHHSMGTLRLGVLGRNGQTVWLDSLGRTTTTTFFPGYNDYQVRSSLGDWNAKIRIAPTIGSHGLICRVEFDREMPLEWQYGDIWLADVKPRTTQVAVSGSSASFVDPNFPNGIVLAGWDGGNNGRTVADGQSVKFTATISKRVYYIVASWGVTSFDQKIVDGAKANLMTTPAARAWPDSATQLWNSWLNCYLNPALNPDQHFHKLLSAPAQALDQSVSSWTTRRNEFQIRTPDEHLDALINWARAVSEYHRQGPGCSLGVEGYYFYGHISMGWWGKEWAGDHVAIEEMLRLYAVGQQASVSPRFNVYYAGQTRTSDEGNIGWVFWNLAHCLAEDGTPYWVNQVWEHYRWTGNRQFVVDLWPFIKKAVAWETANCDPHAEGLSFSYYPQWNCDSYACPEKSVAATAVGWTILDSAAHMAEVVGDKQTAADYRARADRCRAASDRELWDDKSGILRSVGSDGLKGSHPNGWEEDMAINLGLLDPARGRRAMRWVESQYGFQGTSPDVRLLMTSDLWPLRWSNQWVAVGDTMLCAQAALKCGDVDLWWPYVSTVIHSSFRSFSPGINFAIANTGMGCGDHEDIDSDDPHLQFAVRGLFGIEPDLQDATFSICPAFPSNWKQASIKTPDISYDYQRQGDDVTIHIHTPKPLVKRVRANLTGREVTTPRETDSAVKLTVGSPLPDMPRPVHPPAIQADRQPVSVPSPLTAAEKQRLIMMDLSAVYNIAQEQLMTTPMLFDLRQTPIAVKEWWVNPSLKLDPGPREIDSAQGVKFLTAGRPQGVSATNAPKTLLALSSWKPYPWPAGAKIYVGRKCERLWLLLQNYVHPSKCYLPNGEVILTYSGGKTETTSLIPPYNIDCFYQRFSREGEAVSLGRFDNWPPVKGYSPATFGVAEDYTVCHADSLQIPCDSRLRLDSIEFRATCSEGILGLAGLTILTPPVTP